MEKEENITNNNIRLKSQLVIEELLLHLKSNPNRLAKDLGYKSNVKIQHIKSGRNSISVEVAKDIVRRFPEINYNWLLTGEGSMLKEENEANLIKVEHKQNAETQHEVVRIPYYDVDFAGGFNSAELFSSVMPSFYISSPTFERAEFACNLVGNSISNRVPNGSVIGLREINDWQIYFPTGEIYAVVLKNDLRTVKIVKRSKDNKNKILLIPDPKNEHNHIGYDVEEVDVDFVVKFFQVVAWASFERLAQ
ncbi:hypothetical protein [Bergeyella zoohelcum]|uniref:hypothetical protein n=1 Tax=Bergeyella zoohelcum TaxID=1015 RepID=UPI003735621E